MKHILAVTLGSAIVFGASLRIPAEVVLPIAQPLYVAAPSLRSLHEYIIASEATRVGLDTLLAIAISRHENPNSDPKFWSYNDCCVGLLQVNVLYKGSGWLNIFYEECEGGATPEELYDPRTNACYGVRIFLWHLGEESGDTLRALAAYSGYARGYVRRVLVQRDGLVTSPPVDLQ